MALPSVVLALAVMWLIPGAVMAAQPPEPAPVTASGFDALAGRAFRARQDGRLDDAVVAYRDAVALKPEWDEGWWYLATILHEKGENVGARYALDRFLRLKPETWAGWTLRGISEFRLGRFEQALADLDRAHRLGAEPNPELRRAFWWHRAILLTRIEAYELALEPLTLLARSERETPELVEATGLMMLRLPYLPGTVGADRRDLVMTAGRAGFAWLARAGTEAAQRFQVLVERFPTTAFVHYAHGVFLLQSNGEAALQAFERELAIQPNNVYAHLEIAFERLRVGEASLALPHAEKAMSLEPTLFAARNALGRALVEVGDLARGIRELQAAVALAPESPEGHFALANAYSRAGRKAEATRHRQLFTQLSQKQGKP